VKEQLSAIIYYWQELFGDSRVTVKQVIDEVERPAKLDKVDDRKDLGQALMAVAGIGGQHGKGIDPRRLGNYLKTHAGRVIDGYRIVKDGKPQAGKQLWRLERAANTSQLKSPDSSGAAQGLDDYS
jgi:hypothetical protein